MPTRLALPAAAALSLSACVIVVDAGSGEVEPSYFAQLPAPPAEATVEAFDALKASSGASVTVQPGTEYRVVLDDEAVRTGAYEVRGGMLIIECRRPCRNGMKGQATVYAPRVASLRVSSGAAIAVEEGVEAADMLSLRASSGGAIDAAALSAARVEADASSGGSIVATVRQRLDAEASSGGSISYRGDPQVSSSTSTGGSVRRSGGA